MPTTRTTRHRIRRLVLIVLGIYLCVCLLAYLFQRKLMYFPDTRAVAPQAGMEHVDLTTSDGVTLAASWWPGSSDVVFLLFHGNAGHRGHRFPLYAPLHRRGHSIFFLDYRGYGGSEGSPTEEGLARDADAAVGWLQQHAAAKRVFYFGESLGSSVALGLAARHAPAGLILQSGGLDLGAVGQGHYPFLPVKWIMHDRFDGRTSAKQISSPALVIHGATDRIVPIKHGRRLHDALPDKTSWLEIPNAGHNDLVHVGGNELFEAIDRFVRKSN